MPNKRADDKRQIGFWLTVQELRDFKVILDELGYEDRCVWFREHLKNDLVRARRKTRGH